MAWATALVLPSTKALRIAGFLVRSMGEVRDGDLFRTSRLKGRDEAATH